MNTPNNKNDIDKLNSFLRGERSAVETYRQVMEKSETPAVRTSLQTGHDSHAKRARLLEEKVRVLGGEPSKDSGAWGSFAKAVEGGAKMFGMSAAVATLEQGEDHGLADYKRDLKDLTPQNQEFVRTNLLVEQERSHALLSALKKQV